jgi:hypothetical protein
MEFNFWIRSGFLSERDFKQSKFILEKGKRFDRGVMRWTTGQMADYHEGNAAGLRGLGRMARGDKSTDATPVHLTLGLWWRFVKGFTSVTELHRWLDRMLGAKVVGSKKRVEKICERLGLKFRGRGAPRRNPTVAQLR